MIVGIVLAAGVSRRMGQHKPLMQWQGKPWITHAVDRLVDAGCDRVVSVVSDPAVAREAPATVIWNDQTNLGMLHSVQRAIAAVPEPASFVVCPCDMPALSVQTVSMVVTHLGPQNLVVPQWGGRRGHPLGIGSESVKKILRMDARRSGLDRLLKEDGFRLHAVSVDDPACLLDFDTPEEWKHFVDSHKEGIPDG